jgi:hypothetical protein
MTGGLVNEADDRAIRKALDRWFLIVLAVFAIPLVVAVFTDAALTWDGAYLLFRTLDTGIPIIPHDRLLDAPIHRPVLWVNAFTNSLPVLRATFGVVHVITPLIVLALSWWVVRKDAPALIIWPVLSIGLATLPGQINFISEGIKTNQLIWPILLAVLIGLPARAIPMLAVVSVAIMFLHPASVLMLAAVSAAALVVGSLQPGNRDRLYPVAICIFAAAVLRYGMIADKYETDSMSVEIMRRQWRNAAMGLPGISLALTFLVMVLIIAAGATKSFSRELRVLVIGLVALAGGVLMPWALEPARWWDALEFRGPANVVTLAAAGFAFLDAIWAIWTRGNCQRAVPEIRLQAARAIAVGFAIVLSTQCIMYGRTIEKMNDALAASPGRCLSLSQLPDMPESPLNLWSTPSLSLLYQGWRPSRIVLQDGGCEQAMADGTLAVSSPGSAYESDRIDLLPLQWQLGGHGACWWEERSGWLGIERTNADRRRWTSGTGTIRVWVGVAGELTFTGLLTTLRLPNTITVAVNGEVQQSIEFSADHEATADQLRLRLSPGENVITFDSVNGSARTRGDARDLAISLLNVRPVVAATGERCELHR